MKNAMLLFLSDVKLQSGRLSEQEYDTDSLGIIKAGHTNEASLLYMDRKLAQNGESLDYVFVFVSNLVGGRGESAGNKISYIEPGADTAAEYTHQAVFEKLILHKCPQLANKLIYCDFDEDKDNVQAIQYVLKMVGLISDRLSGSPDEWKIHVDLAGGLRHAAVLMLSVLHMLRYTGLQIGDAVYANFSKKPRKCIEDVSIVHEMFEMVSGTDSVLNSANLRDIQAYFDLHVPAEQQSSELRSLLTALESFSNAVKLCHTGKFEGAARDLASAMSSFRQLEHKSVHEELFAQVLHSLERDYADIVREDASRQDIIRWCLDKDFLQQAMTLFNEWMPEILIEKKAYYPSLECGEQIVEFCKLKNDKKFVTWQDYFVKEFSPKSYKALMKEMYTLESNKAGKKISKDELEQLLSKLPSHLQPIDRNKKLPSVQMERFESLWHRSSAKSLDNDVVQRMNACRNMLSKRLAVTDFDDEDVRDLLGIIIWVRIQRNKINHAMYDGEVDIELLRRVLYHGLNMLRVMDKMKQGECS